MLRKRTNRPIKQKPLVPVLPGLLRARADRVHALPPAARACRGFTLLELMVVLVLVGIIFSFAVLSLGGDELAETMERETRRLAALIGMASDEAVIRGEELAIHFSDDSYAFLMLRNGDWQPDENDRLLKTYRLPAGIQIRLEVEGEPLLLIEPDEEDEEDEEERLVPQVYILSSGEMTPFSATLVADQSYYRYHLSATLLGELEWEVEDTF
jgi:general secretion pathway protein H